MGMKKTVHSLENGESRSESEDQNGDDEAPEIDLLAVTEGKHVIRRLVCAPPAV